MEFIEKYQQLTLFDDGLPRNKDGNIVYKEFPEVFVTAEEENEILKRIIKNMYNLTKFLHEYGDLVDDMVDNEATSNEVKTIEEKRVFLKRFREKYEATAMKYVRELRDNVEFKEIVKEAKILVTAVDESMDSGQIGDFLDLQVFSVECALTKYKTGELPFKIILPTSNN